MLSILHPTLLHKLRLARLFKTLRPGRGEPPEQARGDAAPASGSADPTSEAHRLAVSLALVREHLNMQLHGVQVGDQDRSHARHWRSSLLLQQSVASDARLAEQLGTLVSMQRLSCEAALDQVMLPRARQARSVEENDAIRIVHRRILRDLQAPETLRQSRTRHHRERSDPS
jgi:hypothetical protein